MGDEEEGVGVSPVTHQGERRETTHRGEGPDKPTTSNAMINGDNGTEVVPESLHSDDFPGGGAVGFCLMRLASRRSRKRRLAEEIIL